MHSASPTSTLLLLVIPSFLFLSHFPHTVSGDCWLIEGDKGYVWLAICSQNQPPYETIPQHINNTVHDLRLNENKLKAVLFSSMYRFTNLTDLNLTKNEISYIEDGAFAGQANLQVRWGVNTDCQLFFKVCIGMKIFFLHTRMTTYHGLNSLLL